MIAAPEQSLRGVADFRQKSMDDGQPRHALPGRPALAKAYLNNAVALGCYQQSHWPTT